MSANMFLSVLLLIFVTLKLTGAIDWSWWWVLSPFWIPLVIALIFGAISLVIRLIETPEQKLARLLKEYADALPRKP